MRVYKLAKEFNIKSSDLLKELRALGINISSHMSGLDSEQLRVIRTAKEREKNKDEWKDNMQSVSETIRKEENRLLNDLQSFGGKHSLPSKFSKDNIKPNQDLPVTFWGWIRNLFGIDKDE